MVLVEACDQVNMSYCAQKSSSTSVSVLKAGSHGTADSVASKSHKGDYSEEER